MKGPRDIQVCRLNVSWWEYVIISRGYRTGVGPMCYNGSEIPQECAFL